MKILRNRINKIGRNLLIACIFGDGCVSKAGQFSINHSWKQYQYTIWLKQLLEKNGIKTGILSRTTGSNGYLKYTVQYQFRTEITSFTKILRKFMYNGSRVIFDRKFLNRLSAQGLAIWYMDDGSLLRRKYKGHYCGFYARFSTYCTEKEADTIIKYFNEVWNLYPTKIREHTKNNKYTINFGAKEGRKLFNIIRPYMCPSLMYKVIPDIEETKQYYNVQDIKDIYIQSTLEEDRKLVEAHNSVN